MEKLGNAICLEKGFYKQTNLTKKTKGKGMKLGHLKRKGKGR
jgi:hypothetical protein